ncbi:ileal sodium/bile acid cotransporter-like [Centruroides sculpturatus]|uniref:ileal sodium/bile acid cotransporter-like n=1 Tax=Centruroides sculpturatus TaxID=218467 RepID=UPI000C6DEAFA|nr:ileal sodium/bile acid cotransporter-like [Centruroides sculpturatus]
MCPVVLLTLILSFLLLLLEMTAAITVSFSPKRIDSLKEDDVYLVNYSVDVNSSGQEQLQFVSEKPSVANVEKNATVDFKSDISIINGTFLVKGKFLGYTKIRLKTEEGTSSQSLPVVVVRKKSALSIAFTASVAILVSLNYINMGCALDLKIVRQVLAKPVAPAVGFFSQFLTMPLLAFGLAKLLFDEPFMMLGLFTFGCSPGGGASNMWTVILKGNLNLSLTMTFISTVAALGMIPLWLFTLGTLLFKDTKTVVPYSSILTTLVSMLIPLGVGLLFQRFLPRVAKFCRKILALVSILMILFIIIFGTYANFYMFKLFTWQIVVASMVNVWTGFLFGAIISKICGLATEDIIAVAIETGVQNTGIAIILLGFSLKQPDSDLASVVPVAGSIMTPFPLLIAYAIQKFWNWKKSSKEKHREIIFDDLQESMLKSPNSSTGGDLKQISNGRN